MPLMVFFVRTFGLVLDAIQHVTAALSLNTCIRFFREVRMHGPEAVASQEKATKADRRDSCKQAWAREIAGSHPRSDQAGKAKRVRLGKEGAA